MEKTSKIDRKLEPLERRPKAVSEKRLATMMEQEDTKLYLLKRTDMNGVARWDFILGAVVRALSSKEARKYLKNACDDRDAEAWLDPKRSSCHRIYEYGRPQIILLDIPGG